MLWKKANGYYSRRKTCQHQFSKVDRGFVLFKIVVDLCCHEIYAVNFIYERRRIEFYINCLIVVCSDSDGQSAHLSLNRKRPFSVKKAENRFVCLISSVWAGLG